MTPVWTIDWCETTPTAASPSEAVLQVGWRCSGSEDTYSGTVYSTCTLPAADPQNFIPYSSLTEAEVLNWIWANGVNQAATEAAVAQQIEMQKNPVVIQPKLPWLE